MTTPKTILVFCDGTGQDGIVACDIMGNSQETTRSATNVLRLSRAVQPFKEAGNQRIPQIVYYITGIGTDSDFNTTGLLSEKLIQAFGRIVASKIRDAYVFIAQNYQAGDEICLFGYSRGAYTARKVAGLIDRVGLLSRRELGKFTTIWNELNENKYKGPRPSPPIKVKCVGVWDTVGSVRTIQGKVIDSLSIKDCSLPSCIEYALHAVAFHENRAVFPPTLWDTTKSNPGKDQTLKQVWFGGCHADVGGGQLSRDLADISLFWMAGEIESFVALDNDILWASHQRSSAVWGASQPYNSFENDMLTRILGAATRDGEFKRGIPTLLHESMDASPSTSALHQRRNMITLASITSPGFAPMNKRDKELKAKWATPPTSGTVSFEKPAGLSDLVFGFAAQVAGASLELAGAVARGVGRLFS